MPHAKRAPIISISHLIENNVRESMHVFVLDEFLKENARRAVQQSSVVACLASHANLTTPQSRTRLHLLSHRQHLFISQIKAGRPLTRDTLNARWLLTNRQFQWTGNGHSQLCNWLNSASWVLISTCSAPVVQTGERKQTLFDLDLWPTTLTYNSRLAKVKVDPHAKIRSKVKRFKQDSAHRQTDGHTHTCTHMDATKCIISPAMRSITTVTDTFATTFRHRDGNVVIVIAKLVSPLHRFIIKYSLDGWRPITTAAAFEAANWLPNRHQHKWLQVVICF